MKLDPSFLHPVPWFNCELLLGQDNRFKFNIGAIQFEPLCTKSGDDSPAVTPLTTISRKLPRVGSVRKMEDLQAIEHLPDASPLRYCARMSHLAILQQWWPTVKNNPLLGGRIIEEQMCLFALGSLFWERKFDEGKRLRVPYVCVIGDPKDPQLAISSVSANEPFLPNAFSLQSC